MTRCIDAIHVVDCGESPLVLATMSSHLHNEVAVRLMIHVRLIKKLALRLNGVDLSSVNVGDVIELPDATSRMLIAEGWGEPVSEKSDEPPFLLTNQPLVSTS